LLDVGLQRLVNETLIIPAPALIDLALKPVDHLVVEANGDTGLARGSWCYGATLGPS